jgi:hypothetical protein
MPKRTSLQSLLLVIAIAMGFESPIIAGSNPALGILPMPRGFGKPETAAKMKWQTSVPKRNVKRGEVSGKFLSGSGPNAPPKSRYRFFLSNGQGSASAV